MGSKTCRPRRRCVFSSKYWRNKRKNQTLYQLRRMEHHRFENQKPFLKMEVQRRHKTKLLFGKLLVLSVLTKNGLHRLLAASVLNPVMSMEQLYCKTKCIYYVETTTGVILVTFRIVKLTVIMQHVILVNICFVRSGEHQVCFFIIHLLKIE